MLGVNQKTVASTHTTGNSRKYFWKSIEIERNRERWIAIKEINRNPKEMIGKQINQKKAAMIITYTIYYF